MSEIKPGLSYGLAGVNIEAGNQAVKLIKPLAESTFDSRVLTEIGGFSGLYGLGSLDIKDPVLVSSTDGVGTKIKIAILANKHDTVGIDLVAMSVNDILVAGAKPLFFLDYIATSQLIPEKIQKIVHGIASGCRQAGCALLGGETAEMPDFYQEGDYDLAGFAVGIVERNRIIDGSLVGQGHKIIAIASSGLHSNGYSLVRKIIFEKLGLQVDSPLFSKTVAEVLLTPTRIYCKSILATLRISEVHGMVHVTGGGITENLPRILPNGCQAVIDTELWEVPPIFAFLQKEGKVDSAEMYRTFNMGVGFLLLVPPQQTESVMTILNDHGEQAWVIGKVQKQISEERVIFLGIQKS
ncbi:MAG: phosphoribosylformylglycinamidine cyclo-ligase [Deltaproteobacteria bacterium]|jgi:phosphoribosylformylglycinamidine cyclo-ligase|nr:phosphoribosylformylglycinamidine cyclo-ligase [Deltaproteobacteria bacterium]